ncbi:MAG: M14 family zinc carboxypeptidase [Gemmatimonadales bacterium]
MPEPSGDRVEFLLPEFTRSLRGFASPRALGSPDHDRVFGPLVAARRAAARVESVEGQLAAFDAVRLRRALEEAIAGMCAERTRKDGAARRALAARMTDLAEPAFAAAGRIEHAAALVRASREPGRSEAWRAWVVAVQALFDGSDRFWIAVQDSIGPARVKARRKKKRTRALGVVAFAALVLPALAHPVRAQHVTLRVTGVRAESLLAHGFDVVGAERGAVLVVADPGAQARMAGFGWRGTILRSARAAVLRSPGLQVVTATTVYRSYDDPVRGVRAFVDSMARNNPRVFVDTIGKSYEGRPMLAVKIGFRDDAPTRPNVLYMATYHAREWAATDFALRLITYLANPPAGSARLDSLLQTRDIWVVPVANPDGYQYTFTNDRLWRKTRSPQAGGAVGVDMNRNHRQNWGLDDAGSSPDPSSDIYRGPSPASEIEVRNIEAFHAAHPPAVSVSYHTYAGLLLYPPGAVYGQLPTDRPIYRTLAGTNLHSAVTDHVVGSSRSFYAPSSAWMLYSTNGEYNDWAATKYGTVSFTPEMSSGYTAGDYYGFEFPDDEAQLRQLFDDNLPFALDALESARDPFAYASPTTFGHSDRVVLESVSPDIRVTVPAGAAPSASILAPAAVPFHIDSVDGGRYTRRLVSSAVSRPRSLSVSAGGVSTPYSVVEINGAERTESGWTATRFTLDSSRVVAGKYSWYAPGTGDLRSPVVRMPADADTVSLMFWTEYAGSGFDESPFASVMLSSDGGSTFQPVMRLEGFAPVWYPEDVTIGGVKGKQLVFDFVSSGLPWNLDEIAIVVHGVATTAAATGTVAFRPSENPVHRSVVYFPWPLAATTGEIQVFDIGGRLVWKTAVTGGATVSWDLRSAAVPNGVYVVVARGGGQTLRLKLYVVRGGQ